MPVRSLTKRSLTLRVFGWQSHLGFRSRWFSYGAATGLLAAAAILLTLIASAFEIYPFSARVVLFLVPLAFFIIAAAIDVIDFKLGGITSSFCALLLFFAMAPISLKVLVEPRAPLATKFKEALQIVAQNSISGDALADRAVEWESV